MNSKNLIKLAKECRAAQVSYYKNRKTAERKTWLEASKSAERELESYVNYVIKNCTQELFDHIELIKAINSMLKKQAVFYANAKSGNFRYLNDAKSAEALVDNLIISSEVKSIQIPLL